MTPQQKQTLTQLQRGIEITSRPFQALETLKQAQAEGLVRRFGGVFDARRLGYKSMLCALDVSAEQLEEQAAAICAHPGVTHCYERFPMNCRAGTVVDLPALQKEKSYPNLWFTFAAPHDEFDFELKAFHPTPDTRHSPLLQLPAIRRFKIDVVFDLQCGGASVSGEVVSPAVSTIDFSEEEKALVRLIDQQLPLVETPFAAVAEELGQSEEWVLETLRAWKEQGVLRRIAAILYHREAGFAANAMCVWPVDDNRIEEAGRRVAARPEVTHCYQRPRLEAFPFDLYAMIHAANRDEIEALFADISVSCGLSGGELFLSGREFKKTSITYFR